MIETPSALLDIRSIAHHRRVTVLVVGTNDLIKELRTVALLDRSPLIPHLATALVGARDAGKDILDGVYNDVRDPDGFRAEAEQGKALGFDGKTLIHPSQVEPTNEVWAPTADEVEVSRRVIEAFEAAEAAGRGVITVDGRMIENLHVDNARRVLAVADAIAALG
jgi:citrate lyase subunit beta/citryl-CoA lyase